MFLFGNQPTAPHQKRSNPSCSWACLNLSCQSDWIKYAAQLSWIPCVKRRNDSYHWTGLGTLRREGRREIVRDRQTDKESTLTHCHGLGQSRCWQRAGERSRLRCWTGLHTERIRKRNHILELLLILFCTLSCSTTSHWGGLEVKNVSQHFCLKRQLTWTWAEICCCSRSFPLILPTHTEQEMRPCLPRSSLKQSESKAGAKRESPCVSFDEINPSRKAALISSKNTACLLQEK